MQSTHNTPILNDALRGLSLLDRRLRRAFNILMVIALIASALEAVGVALAFSFIQLAAGDQAINTTFLPAPRP